MSCVSDISNILSTSIYFSISSAKLSNFCFKESISTLGTRPKCLDSSENSLFGGKYPKTSMPVYFSIALFKVL